MNKKFLTSFTPVLRLILFPIIFLFRIKLLKIIILLILYEYKRKRISYYYDLDKKNKIMNFFINKTE